MDYSNVVEVFETSGYAIVNDKLKNGWIILAVAPGKDTESGEPYIQYSLGRPVVSCDSTETK